MPLKFLAVLAKNETVNDMALEKNWMSYLGEQKSSCWWVFAKKVLCTALFNRMLSSL